MQIIRDEIFINHIQRKSRSYKWVYNDLFRDQRINFSALLSKMFGKTSIDGLFIIFYYNGTVCKYKLGLLILSFTFINFMCRWISVDI